MGFRGLKLTWVGSDVRWTNGWADLQNILHTSVILQVIQGMDSENLDCSDVFDGFVTKAEFKNCSKIAPETKIKTNHTEKDHQIMNKLPLIEVLLLAFVSFDKPVSGKVITGMIRCPPSVPANIETKLVCFISDRPKIGVVWVRPDLKIVATCDRGCTVKKIFADKYSIKDVGRQRSTLIIHKFNPKTDVGDWCCKDGPNGSHDSCDLKLAKNCTLQCKHGRREDVYCACHCENKWTGKLCDTCNLVCVNGNLTDCKCKCWSAFRGETCEICDKTCVHGSVPEGKCECACDDQWHGNKCDKCEVSCEHGHKSPKGCKCICDNNYVGINCDTCQRSCNHGTVTKDNCTCSCQSDWIGENCNICDLKCMHGTRMEPCKCACEKDWTGPLCTICNYECDHGEVDNTTCLCDCDENWSGPRCNITICNYECDHGEVDNTTCLCDCDENWSGPRCNIKHEVKTPEKFLGDNINTYLIIGIVAAVLVVFGIPLVYILHMRKKQAKPKKEKEAITYDQSYYQNEQTGLYTGQNTDYKYDYGYGYSYSYDYPTYTGNPEPNPQAKLKAKRVEKPK